MGKMEAAEQTDSVIPLQNSRAETTVLRQLSAEQQNGWIERLFARLAALYGAAFGRQWEGTDLAQVKVMWADKLGGFTSKHIADALNACDEKPYPPNLPEFLIMCRTSAISKRVELEPLPKKLSSSKGAVRIEQIKRIFNKKDGEYDSRAWAKGIIKDYEVGTYSDEYGYRLACDALHHEPVSVDRGEPF